MVSEPIRVALEVTDESVDNEYRILLTEIELQRSFVYFLAK